LKSLILGPTFTIRLDLPPDGARDRLDAWIRSEACGYDGDSAGLHFQLAEIRSRRRRWSPWLTLEVRETDGGSEAFGRFNPSPGIWTGYMLASLALLTIGFGAAMWGAAEMLTGQPPWALLVIPACLLVLVLMWLFSAAGQRLARERMDAMEADIRRALNPAASDAG